MFEGGTAFWKVFFVCLYAMNSILIYGIKQLREMNLEILSARFAEGELKKEKSVDPFLSALLSVNH